MANTHADLVSARELSEINSMQTVDFGSNKLSSVPQRLFEKWVSVETISLNNNQLTLLPASLGTLLQLSPCHGSLQSD